MTGLDVRGVNAVEYGFARDVLWPACFPEDGPGFCDYYFEYRTRPEYVLGAFLDGGMVGMLHMIPQRIMLFDSVKDIGFVAGVATLPEYRNRGVAAALMERSFELMGGAGLCAAVLQPFSEDFYKKFGFETFVSRREYRYAAPPAGEDDAHAPDARELFQKYTRFASRYNGMAVRSERDCEILLGESAGGARFIANAGAYAMYYPGETTLVMELCGERGAMSALLRSIPAKGELVAFSPMDIEFEGECESETKPFNMLRPLDARKLAEGLPVDMDGLMSGAYGVNYSFESY